LASGYDNIFVIINRDDNLTDFADLSGIINSEDFNLFVVAKNKLIGSFLSQRDKLIVIYC
jgi:hypothetical protein